VSELDVFLTHPVRAGLLRLLREHGAVTATDAAAALGLSSGLCSFHLRQLARHGHIEEIPGAKGRVRPWRLADTPRPEPGPDGDFGRLARGLEDESYRHWQERRHTAPADWQHDEAFSAVVHLTPEELTEAATAIRAVLARYADRDHRPERARPVGVLARLFPLLPEAD
jgi:hypothetical protein